MPSVRKSFLKEVRAFLWSKLNLFSLQFKISISAFYGAPEGADERLCVCDFRVGSCPLRLVRPNTELGKLVPVGN